MTGVLAALESLDYALQRKAKGLHLAEPVSLFPCQMRLFGCGSSGCLVLLSLDGLAFPAPRHSPIIAVAMAYSLAGAHNPSRQKQRAAPILGKVVRKSDIAKKND